MNTINELRLMPTDLQISNAIKVSFDLKEHWLKTSSDLAKHIIDDFVILQKESDGNIMMVPKELLLQIQMKNDVVIVYKTLSNSPFSGLLLSLVNENDTLELLKKEFQDYLSN